jgi:hypothetical protein
MLIWKDKVSVGMGGVFSISEFTVNGKKEKIEID